MKFKKNLKSKTGQASLEYFILLTAIVMITLISQSTFLSGLREKIQGSGGFFSNAAGRIIEADKDN